MAQTGHPVNAGVTVLVAAVDGFRRVRRLLSPSCPEPN